MDLFDAPALGAKFLDARLVVLGVKGELAAALGRLPGVAIDNDLRDSIMHVSRTKIVNRVERAAGFFKKVGRLRRRLSPLRLTCALTLAGAGLITLAMTSGAFAVGAGKGSKDGAAESDSSADVPSAETRRAPTRRAGGKGYGIPQVELINQQIRAGWTQRSMSPSAPATDGEWARRLFLDVLGRIPSVDELNRFFSDGSADKRVKLVDRLLGDDYVDEYARNMTTIWTNILVGRAAGTEENRLVSKEGMQQALRRAFQRNMPWDKFAYECISAKGVNRPGEPGFNGWTNFLTDKMAENGVQATARTSQVFLGLQVQCTQCHNHPFNEWKQNQFWELNAFFRQTHSMKNRDRPNVDIYELSNQNFPGDDNRPDEAVLFYELRNGLTKAAYPVFVDGAKLKTDSGYVDQIDRRTELARLVATSDYLGKALVNRLWGHFMGYGFTKPVDDMGPHNPPTHPELLEGLAVAFKKSSYDVKQLIRWITLSETYALSSRFMAKNKMDDPSLGEKPAFAHFYMRQMRAEELYESLIVATEAQKTQGNYEEQEKTKSAWLQQFTLAFGTDDNEEATTFNGTIPQVLMMMNGDLVKNAISTDQGCFLQRLVADSRTDFDKKVSYLYLAGLARKPTAAEMQDAQGAVADRKGNGAEALQDVWWTVLNSNEFIINH